MLAAERWLTRLRLAVARWIVRSSEVCSYVMPSAGIPFTEYAHAVSTVTSEAACLGMTIKTRREITCFTDMDNRMRSLSIATHHPFGDDVYSAYALERYPQVVNTKPILGS